MNYKVAIAAALIAAVASAGASTALPAGWIRFGTASPGSCDAGADQVTVPDGKSDRAIVLSCGADPGGFVTAMQTFDASAYLGKRVRFSANLRGDSVKEWGGIWMRVDAPDGKVTAFDNMQSRGVTGTANWKHYDVVLDVAPTSAKIALGLLLQGTGRLWMNGVKIEVVGKDQPLTSSPQTGPKNLDLSE